jgi:hypothetical protein
VKSASKAHSHRKSSPWHPGSPRSWDVPKKQKTKNKKPASGWLLVGSLGLGRLSRCLVVEARNPEESKSLLHELNELSTVSLEFPKLKVMGGKII